MSEYNIFTLLKNSRVDDMNMMLDDGISPSSISETGDSLLSISIKLNNYDAFESLCERKAYIHYRDIEGNTLLHIASMYRHGLSYAKCLILLGLSLHSKNMYGEKPSSIAKRYHNDTTYNYLKKLEHASILFSDLWS